MKQKTLARFSLLPGSAWLVALFVVPFGLLLMVSVATSNIIGQPVYGWHTDAYKLIFHVGIFPVLWRSLFYAAAATAICLVLGYTVAYTLARYGGKRRNLLLLLVLVPWLVDYLIRIYAWIQVVGGDGVLNSAMHSVGFSGQVNLLGHAYTVIGGLVYNFLPYMILALYVSIDQIDGALIEAGRDLYANPFTTLMRVTVPCTLPGITTGCLMVFLPAVGDFATAQLLGSPNQYMIGNIISNEIQTTGALPIGAAMTFLLVAVLALIALIGFVMLTPWRRRLAGAHGA